MLDDGIILPFGILDLCKYNTSITPAQGIRETLQLVELAERSGYSRYWLTEHHVPYAITPAPELLLPILASRTKRIRIGIGGIIISYYSPYKIAEIGHTLQIMSDDRFDLGLCRGPGVIEELVAKELVCGNIWELRSEDFENKVTNTVNLIRGKEPVLKKIKVYTTSKIKPQLWMLGLSENTVSIAKSLEMSLALPLFITRNEDIIFSAVNIFRESSKSNSYSNQKSILAVSVVCDESDIKAMRRNKHLIGIGMMPSNLVGSYKNVTEKLVNLLKRFDMDELLIVQLSTDLFERTETYESLAESYKASLCT
jgi:luciferase family oxidoreductase group 1